MPVGGVRGRNDFTTAFIVIIAGIFYRGRFVLKYEIMSLGD